MQYPGAVYIYLPEKFSHKMYIRIPHTSSQSYTIWTSKKSRVNLFNLDKKTHRLCPNNEERWWLYWKKVSAMRNGVKFDATPSLPKIGVVCLVKGKVGALKSEDSLFFSNKASFSKTTNVALVKSQESWCFLVLEVQNSSVFFDINSDLFGLWYYFPKILVRIPGSNHFFTSSDV